MKSRAEQKEKTRRKLIDATLRLSAERGFATLSLREVCKGAGITPAAFYRHFRDMEELGLVLVDEVGLGLRELLRAARRRFQRRGGVARGSVETFIKYVTENPNLFRVLLGERQGGSNSFQKALHAEINRFVEDLTVDLERESRKAKRPLEEAGLAAEAICAVAFTVGAEVLDLPKHRRLDLTERIINEVNMILRGASLGGRRA
ncbi:MAG: HTH-type transcriptional repressor FabR [Deltaproteobacteria bacterium]|nr:HTH-type transcriptional repressor FabR [Deltaproteobacteria bacterium]